jgi:hypothetical protein
MTETTAPLIVVTSQLDAPILPSLVTITISAPTMVALITLDARLLLWSALLLVTVLLLSATHLRVATWNLFLEEPWTNVVSVTVMAPLVEDNSLPLLLLVYLPVSLP